MDCTALCSVHGPAVASLAHLVTGCEAGQVRQDFQNIDTAKLAVVVADILIGLVLSKCHGCSASGVTPTLGGWNGLREMDWKKDGQENKLAAWLEEKEDNSFSDSRILAFKFYFFLFFSRFLFLILKIMLEC